MKRSNPFPAEEQPATEPIAGSASEVAPVEAAGRADDGELTRTQKVRRGFIAERYEPLIAALYDGSTEQEIETPVTFEDGRAGSLKATVKIRDAKTFAAVQEAA